MAKHTFQKKHSTKDIVIAPSILAADISKLADDIRDVEKAGADWLHIDVMDGRFVPPITFGDNIVKAARQCSKLFLDVHLMIEEPERHIKQFKLAGSHRVIIHQETSPHLWRTLTEIKALGISNGVAINPATPVNTVFDILEICDLVLIMTVNPGWGGQSFIPHCLEKIRALKAEIDRVGSKTLIEVDGGITKETAKQCIDAGASVLVAGSSVFGARSRSTAIKELRGS